MNSRPKPGESEEDILKQQEEFFKLKAEHKIKPSVTVESQRKGSNKPNLTYKQNINLHSSRKR